MSDKQNNSRIVENIRNPFLRFFQIEASGGIVLLIFTIIALIWANSIYGETYLHLWEEHLTFGLGRFVISQTVLHWINDGLMAVFFFVVGLEIKREMVAGELSSFKQAALPITAAIGGMVIPALLFVLLNEDQNTNQGWGVPMATDIAFSLGILSLLGSRVPLSLKVFLVAFAIVDDLGAILVIAVFYSSDLHLNYLIYGLLIYLLLIIFNLNRLRYIPLYIIPGLIIWFFFLKSGIHPTIAGVLVAFSVPASRKIRFQKFYDGMNESLNDFYCNSKKGQIALSRDQLEAIDNMEYHIMNVQSPLQMLEHSLHGFVTYFIMPLFALTNAGVIFQNVGVGEIFSSLSLQIEMSLILGKVLGIFAFSWLSVKLGLAVLPNNTKWIHILSLGFLGGIGFTMSLFIANLAFAGGVSLNPAKIGILTGSLIAGIIGYFLLRATLPAPLLSLSEHNNEEDTKRE